LELLRIETHPGGFDIVHVKDSVGNSFATRLSNVFIIGKGTKSLVTLPKRKGVKLTILEEKERLKNRELVHTPAPAAAATTTA